MIDKITNHSKLLSTTVDMSQNLECYNVCQPGVFLTVQVFMWKHLPLPKFCMMLDQAKWTNYIRYSMNQLFTTIRDILFMVRKALAAFRHLCATSSLWTWPRIKSQRGFSLFLQLFCNLQSRRFSHLYRGNDIPAQCAKGKLSIRWHISEYSMLLSPSPEKFQAMTWLSLHSLVREVAAESHE